MKHYKLTLNYTRDGRGWFFDEYDVNLYESENAPAWLAQFFTWKIEIGRKFYPAYNLQLISFAQA